MADSIVLEFHGPFSWTAEEPEDSVLYTAVAERHGIYMWGFPAEQKYLIVYVGITSRSFGQRMQEHLENQMAGQYNVYYPDKLRNGDANRYVWRRIFGSAARKHISKFLCPGILLANLELVRQVRFLAPLERSHHELERIEAAISTSLEKHGGLAATVKEKFNISPSLPGEEEFLVAIPRSDDFLGLAREITVKADDIRGGNAV